MATGERERVIPRAGPPNAIIIKHPGAPEGDDPRAKIPRQRDTHTHTQEGGKSRPEIVRERAVAVDNREEQAPAPFRLAGFR